MTRPSFHGVALELVGEAELLREAVGKAVDDLDRLLLARRSPCPSSPSSRPSSSTRGSPEVDLGLALLGLGLLQAQDVGLVLGDELLEGAFLHHGTDAVDVPRIEFHAREV